jgi:hypothetical protein
MTSPGPFTDVAYLLLARAPSESGSDLTVPVLGAWPETVHWTVTDPALVKRHRDGSILATVPAAFTTVVRFARPPKRPEELRHAIQGEPDRHHSALILGREWTAVEGGGELLAAAFVRRRGDLSAARMRRHWSHEHVEFARALGRGYRQIHVDPVATARANEGLGFDDPELDGIALVYFSDSEALRATRASEAVAIAATEDEVRFIDHGRSSYVVLTPARMEGQTS